MRFIVIFFVLGLSGLLQDYTNFYVDLESFMNLAMFCNNNFLKKVTHKMYMRLLLLILLNPPFNNLFNIFSSN